jgi:D-3-phosphoglycerate dehydrogenase
MDLSIPLVIDFDSTIIQLEGLDELAAIALRRHPKRTEILERIKGITALGMEGKITIAQSLRDRLALLGANKKHLPELVKLLKRHITPSFRRNKQFLTRNADNIWVFTAGFEEYVIPVIQELGLNPRHVCANRFTFAKDGSIVGHDTTRLLSQPRGKIKQVQALKLRKPVWVIGDGFTDLEMKESAMVERFFAFTENIERQSVVSQADKVIKSFDEFLFLQKLPMKHSYPKSKMRVLLLEGIHPKAADALKAEGFSVESLSDALDESDLTEKIRGVSLLGIRSKTKVTKKVLRNADRLLAVGAFCIGTDQIDLAACCDAGVVAFNAPYSNTRSVVELAIGEIIVLIRRVVESSTGLHSGRWMKTASGCYEVRGKKLGIVGYGNIGSQLSVLAESLGMEVYYYDVVEKLALGNARRCRTLAELLKRSDIVTLHVDGRSANRNLISAKEFAMMKKGGIFLNLSRGHVVDIEALAAALKSEKLAGAAIDVFPYEPKSNKEEFISKLRGLPNVLLTPHIGGSTVEAQQNIGEYVASRLVEYVNMGGSFNSVNFPQIQLPSLQGAHRLLHIHRNVPGILAQINGILARNKINILGQYLKTNEQIGYVITDVNRKYYEAVIQELRSIPDTIKFRILY